VRDKTREARTGRAEVLRWALRALLKRLARGAVAWRVVNERGTDRTAVVRNIVADVVGNGRSERCEESQADQSQLDWSCRAGCKEWRGSMLFN